MRVDETVLNAACRVSETGGIDAAVLLAVALVETNAVAFAHFADRREPLIRFEGHYFDRLLAPAARSRARAAGLADPRAGRVRNPSAQSARWQLFEAAAAIDRTAACASVSWGLCQVMDAHWKALGYGGAADLAAAARASAEGQFEIAARFLATGRLADRLVAGDVAGFARGYNGPAYRRNRYDEKIAEALRTARRLLGTNPPLQDLRRGARGDAVRRLQGALVAHGHRLAVDGIFGTATQSALSTFQRAHGLPISAMADAATLARLGLATQPCPGAG
ncbi:N-acetylmuramidase domain-containing protein [Aurantimonas sp. A2-1-M11]|uniref:N-acetylmuramidase domain-containing protein n=1 Tax=Aurantimonas sp. A2-1-M11 TaxID=3113712 RepID=UPI002F927CFF